MGGVSVTSLDHVQDLDVDRLSLQMETQHVLKQRCSCCGVDMGVVQVTLIIGPGVWSASRS